MPSIEEAAKWSAQQPDPFLENYKNKKAMAEREAGLDKFDPFTDGPPKIAYQGDVAVGYYDVANSVWRAGNHEDPRLSDESFETENDLKEFLAADSTEPIRFSEGVKEVT